MRLSLIDKIFNAFVSVRGEKRKEPRREDELPVEIEILSDETDSGPTRVLYAQIKDISAGGVKILTSVYIPLDTPIEMKITLPKLGETIGPRGKVVWGNQVENSDLYDYTELIMTTYLELPLLLKVRIHGTTGSSLWRRFTLFAGPGIAFKLGDGKVKTRVDNEYFSSEKLSSNFLADRYYFLLFEVLWDDLQYLFIIRGNAHGVETDSDVSIDKLLCTPPGLELHQPFVKVDYGLRRYLYVHMRVIRVTHELRYTGRSH